MLHVAFVRNLNQGQRGHVSTADLVAAFDDAGRHDVSPFQSNGTIVFSGEAALAADAMRALVARTGVEREVFTLAWEDLADIVDVHRRAGDAARRELTLHAPVRVALDERSGSEAARRRCRLRQTEVGWTVTVNERDRESNATPVIERLTGAPATSRGLPTAHPSRRSFRLIQGADRRDEPSRRSGRMCLPSFIRFPALRFVPRNGYAISRRNIVIVGLDRTRAAQVVRAARLDRGLSQAELSRAAGMSQPNVAAIETGTRIPSDDALTRLLRAADYRPSLAVEENAQEIVDAGARHGLRDIRVFGSVATGADHFTSDIDLLVRVDRGRGYFDIAAFTNAIEGLTGFPVDVIVDDERRPTFLASTPMATL